MKNTLIQNRTYSKIFKRITFLSVSLILVLSSAFGQIDCTNLPEWKIGDVYATKGTLVKYNLKVYKNKWWTQGDNPEDSGQWGVWEFADNCGAALIYPTVNLTAPVSGSVFTQGDGISISANASDADGTVTRVEFFVGSSSVGVDNTSPYSINWASNMAGSFNVTSVATDNANLSTTSVANAITINPSGNNKVPTVELTAPSNNASFIEGDDIVVSANASDEDGGTITAVKFLAGSTEIGTDNSNPYSVTWTDVPAGTFSITAIATDNENASATSAAHSITIESQSANQLFLNGLPLQIILNEGISKVYTFDATLASILTRNKGIVDVQVNGNKMTITGTKAGRTGLRINANSQSYFIGVRVNHSDGSMPYLPKYVSVGSVSEDSQGDLAFWKDVDIDLSNKEMDIRYIYINGGPITGWRSWNPLRVTNFAKESLRYGLIPFFVYYNIPDGGESFDTDLAHIQDVSYMTAYFEDLNIFMDQAQEILQGDLYGIVLEPDFLGYMQQMGELRLGTNKPNEIPTAVSATTIAPNAGNIVTLVERINNTIHNKRAQGHSIFFGWQLNLWSYAPTSGSRGVLRRTDDNDLGFTAGRAAIKESGEQTTLYGMDAGILQNGANFISIDKYGLDAGISNPQDPFNSTWFFNNDHWNNYLYYVENIHLTSGMPVVLWQLPVGHINSSIMVSAYTGSTFPDLTNVSANYEDSSTDFFFGDTFNPGSRAAYFSQNKYNDAKLGTNGNMVTWGNHFQEAKDAGVIVALFGAGVGASTDGIGDPPTDDYFWVQKAQTYYQNGVVSLSKEYGPDDVWNGGNQNHAPTIVIIKPGAGTQISVGDNVDIEATATDPDGDVIKVDFSVDGNSVGSDNTSPYTAVWQNASSGTHTISATATDDKGASSTASLQVTVSDPNQVLTKITVSPSSATINVNQTLQFTAIAYDQNNNPMSVSIAWSATGGNINSSGLFTATTDGIYTVTALSGSVNGNATVTVNPVGDCNSPSYVENGGYVAGSKVENVGMEYECKPFPYSGWCNGAAWAYEPGVGSYWTDAWIEIGPCSNNSSLKSATMNNTEDWIHTESVVIYPNPFNDKAKIDIVLERESSVEVSIFNSSGQKIQSISKKQLKKGIHELELDCSGILSGYYLYKVLINNKVYSGSLLKE